MTYACPALEFAAGPLILKMQILKNKVLHTVGNFPRRKPTRELHVAFEILCVYDLITKLSRQQTEVMRNRVNEITRNIGVANQHQTKELRADLLTSLDPFSHSYVTASLGSITDTLNYNGDFTHVNESQVEHRDVGKMKTIAQEALRLERA
jgi:transcriptional antiterminator Rof (Rho-off)